MEKLRKGMNDDRDYNESSMIKTYRLCIYPRMNIVKPKITNNNEN